MQLPSMVSEHIPLNNKNTYQIGGSARFYAAPKNTRHIALLLQWANSENVPLFVLGKGSNVLISDEGWPGLVLHMDSSLEDAQILWEGTTVTVSGDVSLNALVKSVADHGFCGTEELAGIPGTVGGAVIMNAGAFSQCIADTVRSVAYCVRESGSMATMDAAELRLGYRTSIFKQSGDIVLAARFSFEKSADPSLLHGRRSEILARRKAKQPLDYPNCGSVFKRPPGNYAGTLIEKCGLKGVHRGGAAVSEKHANFIVNTGDATAEDVRTLIATVQQRVYEESAVLLEPEVIFVGTFNHELYTPVKRSS